MYIYLYNYIYIYYICIEFTDQPKFIRDGCGMVWSWNVITSLWYFVTTCNRWIIGAIFIGRLKIYARFSPRSILKCLHILWDGINYVFDLQHWETFVEIELQGYPHPLPMCHPYKVYIYMYTYCIYDIYIYIHICIYLNIPFHIDIYSNSLPRTTYHLIWMIHRHQYLTLSGYIISEGYYHYPLPIQYYYPWYLCWYIHQLIIMCHMTIINYIVSSNRSWSIAIDHHLSSIPVPVRCASCFRADSETGWDLSTGTPCEHRGRSQQFEAFLTERIRSSGDDIQELYIHTYITLQYITLHYTTYNTIPYHTYIRTHTHTCMHACIYIYIHTYMHT